LGQKVKDTEKSCHSDHQDEINAHIERNRIPEELIDPLVLAHEE